MCMSQIMIIDFLGRYDLKDSWIQCEKCDANFNIEFPHKLVRENLWPGSPTASGAYMFDQDMFLFYDILQKNMPGISESGFIKTLEQFSVHKGRVRLILAGMHAKIIVIVIDVYAICFLNMLDWDCQQRYF